MTAPPATNILIAGAGPAGLAAALFLSEQGLHPRIVDPKMQISPYSKALGVNPRTLSLLESSGLTKRFLASGRKMDKLNIWQENRHIYQNDLSSLHHPYPFMLILPQKTSEELLLEALQERGITVELGTALQSLRQEDRRVQVQFSSKDHLPAAYDWVIGADGASSRVRSQAGIALEGFRYDEEWELYDIDLDTSLARDEGHIILHPQGGLIMIRLQEDTWRVAGNMHSLLHYLPARTQTGTVRWESRFRIHHRLASQLIQDQVLIIGDAAHQHSPVGARGMNLGIEDAYIASQLLARQQLPTFTEVRRPYLKDTVRRINAMTQVLAGSNQLSSALRTHIHWARWAFPFVMPRMRKFLLGLNS